MNIEELQIELKQIEIERNSKRNKVFRDYALSNNPYKIGDIITDHLCSIKIEKIKIYISSFIKSECIYYGTLISKTGKPFKNNKQGAIYQNNINGGIKL